jgi:hypothetical protein
MDNLQLNPDSNKMDNLQLNPYSNKRVTLDLDMFFGRAALLRNLYEMLYYHQSISIVGSRSIGKSSLLWCASLSQTQARFSFDFSRFIFVFLDLHDYLRKTCEDFFQSISEAIIAQCKKANLSLKEDDSVSGEEKFSNILEQIVEKGSFPVLLLDAFDKVTTNKHFDPEFFMFLRSQATRGFVSYVTATLVPLQEVCHREIVGSPFFNIFYTHKLGALSDEEAWDLINDPASRANLPFTQEEASMVLTLAGRHPFFIQRVCFVLYNYKRERGDNPINERTLKRLAYEELLPHFEDIWTELAEHQRLQLIDEARQKHHQDRILPELSESALFRHFVRQTCEIMLFRMTIDDLEKALKMLNNVMELSKTDLGLMKIVTHRLQYKLMPSSRDKGAVIRDVLHQAFETLRGQGVRSDSNPEWIYYNILDYRYFGSRKSLTNQQISARLGCTSIRQYYREREKAIQILYEALLTIEKQFSDEEE